MGGEWGVGASLAMEKVPPERRGFFSGLLQQGYAAGYLPGCGRLLLRVPPAGAGVPLFFIGGVFRPCSRSSSGCGSPSPRCRLKTRERTWNGLGQTLIRQAPLFLVPRPLDGLDEHVIPRHSGCSTRHSLERAWHLDPRMRSNITVISMVGASHRRHRLRPLVASLRPAPHDHRDTRRGGVGAAVVGVRALFGPVDRGRVPDAGVRTGGLGRNPGPHHRARARPGPGCAAGLRLPVRRRHRRRHAQPASTSGGDPGVPATMALSAGAAFVVCALVTSLGRERRGVTYTAEVSAFPAAAAPAPAPSPPAQRPASPSSGASLSLAFPASPPT